jgi:hypothetical protein
MEIRSPSDAVKQSGQMTESEFWKKSGPESCRLYTSHAFEHARKEKKDREACLIAGFREGDGIAAKMISISIKQSGQMTENDNWRKSK